MFVVLCPSLTLSSSLLCVLRVTGWGAVAYRGGAEKNPRGAHEAGAGPSEAAEGGAENHPRQGQVQAQALLLAQGHRMNRRPPPCPLQLALLIIVPSSSSSSSSVERRFVLEVLKERPGVWTRSSRNSTRRQHPPPHRWLLFMLFFFFSFIYIFRELELFV